ncbi:hypothetical protein Syun_003950 [Stephania yunnanensis]|uniref:Uncharacterized protein n=1 Tax=Stephania yunnanensis TaxID=152371 RepID=A0AAP0L235_9MAGN
MVCCGRRGSSRRMALARGLEEQCERQVARTDLQDSEPARGSGSGETTIRTAYSGCSTDQQTMTVAWTTSELWRDQLQWCSEWRGAMTVAHNEKEKKK